MKKPKTSTVILVLSCLMAILYAITDVLLQIYINVEISPTLTGCWYTFWGVELINLANIKNKKIQNGVE